MNLKIVIAAVVFLVLFSSISLAYEQSHPLSQIYPIDTSLNMSGYNITNVSYIGIGTSSPSYPLDIVGNVRWSGTLVSGSVPWARLTNFPSSCYCPDGYAVRIIGTDCQCIQINSTQGVVSGSGTTNYIPIWTGSSSLGNSVIYQGSNVLSIQSNYNLNIVSGSLQIGGTDVIDSSRNLLNIGSITASGPVNIDSGTLYVNAANNRVGIGTTSPQYTLDVLGNARVEDFYLGGAGNEGSIYKVDQIVGYNDLRLASDSSHVSQVYLSTNGNVGIGTTNPSSFKLQVAGNVGPNEDNTYDLGSSSLRWRNAYFAGTIYGNLEGSLTLTGDLNMNQHDIYNATNVNTTNLFASNSIYQNGKQVIDTITANSPITISGSGNSRTIGMQTPLAMNYGGTGASLSPIAGGIVYTNSSSMAITPAGQAGQVLVSGGSNQPIWTSSLTLSSLTMNGNINMNSNSIVNAEWVNSTNLYASNQICLDGVCRTTWPETVEYTGVAPIEVDNNNHKISLRYNSTVFELDQNNNLTLTEPYYTGSAYDSRFINNGEAAGGDLSGTYPNPKVVKIQGYPVSSQAPSVNQSLVWDGSQYVPTSIDTSNTNELQNIWYTIAVPSGSNPVPDSTTDTLTLSTQSGSGLTITGDSSTDTVTFGVDFNTIQKRVSGSCSGNNAIQVINSDGTVTCVEVATPSTANVTGSGSNGQVAFWTGSSTISGDNSLYWDNTNKRLGIGTSNPQNKLNVIGDINATGDIFSKGYNLTAMAAESLYGSGTANYIAKWSDTNSLTNSIIYELNGYIGINTTSPGYNLEVGGTMKASSNGGVLQVDSDGNVKVGI